MSVGVEVVISGWTVAMAITSASAGLNLDESAVVFGEYWVASSLGDELATKIQKGAKKLGFAYAITTKVHKTI